MLTNTQIEQMRIEIDRNESAMHAGLTEMKAQGPFEVAVSEEAAATLDELAHGKPEPIPASIFLCAVRG
jgi:hypothetical protein